MAVPDLHAFINPRRQQAAAIASHFAVLPALKLGGAYNIDANWGITASYLFAFGASTGTTATYTPAAATNFSLDINTQNPTINAFMIGVQYSA